MTSPVGRGTRSAANRGARNELVRAAQHRLADKSGRVELALGIDHEQARSPHQQRHEHLVDERLLFDLVHEPRHLSRQCPRGHAHAVAEIRSRFSFASGASRSHRS